MRILTVFWSPRINKAIIECACGALFEVKLDRWRVQCPYCHKFQSIDWLRDCYVQKVKIYEGRENYGYH